MAAAGPGSTSRPRPATAPPAAETGKASRLPTALRPSPSGTPPCASRWLERRGARSSSTAPSGRPRPRPAWKLGLLVTPRHVRPHYRSRLRCRPAGLRVTGSMPGTLEVETSTSALPRRRGRSPRGWLTGRPHSRTPCSATGASQLASGLGAESEAGGAGARLAQQNGARWGGRGPPGRRGSAARAGEGGPGAGDQRRASTSAAPSLAACSRRWLARRPAHAYVRLDGARPDQLLLE